MRKAEIVQRIAQELGCTTAKAEAAVEALLTTVKTALQQGEPVILRHFGTLTVRAKRARMGRNPKTGAVPSAPPAKATGLHGPCRAWLDDLSRIGRRMVLSRRRGHRGDRHFQIVSPARAGRRDPCGSYIFSGMNRAGMMPVRQ